MTTIPLVPAVGVSVEHTLEKDETHVHRMWLGAGQFAHVRIDQGRAILVQRLRGPGGLSIDHLGEPGRQTDGGADRIVIVADEDGDYEIEVRDFWARATVYTLTVTAAGAATEAERTRFEAQALLAGSLREGLNQTRPPAMMRLLQRSLEMFRALGDAEGELAALITLGLGHWTGDRRLGRPHFEQALALARRIGDAWTEREALNNLAEVAMVLGEPAAAVAHLRASIELGRRLLPTEPNPLAQHNLSGAYRDLGEYQLALRHGHEALRVWVAEGAGGEAYARHNLGRIYHFLGDNESALDHLARTLALWQASGQPFAVAQALLTRGTVRAAMGAHRHALQDFGRALELLAGTTDAVLGSRLAARLASSHAALGAWPEAAAAYERALALAHDAGSRALEAEAVRGLGDHRRAARDAEGALARYAEALRLHQAVEDPAGEAATLLAIARAERDRERLDAARTAIETAIALVERLRTPVTSPDLRASFAASKREYYDLHVDLLMQLHRRDPQAGHAAAALAASERRRARSLTEMLTGLGADIRAGAPSALLAQERQLEQALSAKAMLLTRLLSGAHDAGQAAAARADLRTLAGEREDLRVRIRREHPHYAQLTEPPAADLDLIRGQVLDDDTALLEYALGPDRSYLWVVTRRSFAVHELPRRSTVEAAARDLHGFLAASDRRQVWGQVARASARLSAMVLGPARDALRFKRLLVVPDGALHYVPFAALPHPAAPPGPVLAAPLVESHEIVNLPSASALAVLRRELEGRPPAPRTAAVLADPVLDAADPRVRRGARGVVAPAAEPRDDLRRSAAEAGIARFERLQFTREEADAIARLAGAAHVKASVDFDASRETAMAPSLADFRIVHFATHGLINSRHPALSGLVLSLVDARGRPQDGFVRLHDIYNMKLGAELVVLSACRTALGQDVHGEGLVGLTRGFMYAGAPRVVASLWDVRDRATAELMTRFYERLLVGGLSPAAALRAAQRSMWKEPRWQAPFHWAGFTIQGDWR